MSIEVISHFFFLQFLCFLQNVKTEKIKGKKPWCNDPLYFYSFFFFYLKDDMDLNESITSVMSFFHDIQV